MTLDKIFKYCPVCKHELIITGNKMNCGACGLEYYTNPAPCNAVVIEKDDSILLVKRKVDPQKGKLDFAGGFIEKGETAEQSVRREIREELGCELESLTYFNSYHDTYEFNGITYSTLGIVFIATLHKEVTITIGDDVAGYIYVKKDAIPYNDIAFSSVSQALSDYVKNSESSVR